MRILNTFLALTLTMVATTLFVRPADADTRYVGAFLPQQGPALDQIIGGRYADDYFMELWQAYERGRVQGATANVVLFLSTNGRTQVIHQGTIRAYQYFPIERSEVQRDTHLCVTADRTIRHQRLAAGPNTACATRGSLDEYLAQGNGRQPEDAYGVVAALSARY